MRKLSEKPKPGVIFAIALTAAMVAACDDDDNDNGDAAATQDRPPPFVLPAEFRHNIGDAQAGEEVFRFETFGNEAFWTQAVELPQGIAGAGVTPLQALQLGLSVNSAALHPATLQAVLDAIEQIQGGTSPEDTIFGDPAVTLALINQNAVIGVVNVGPDGEREPLGSDPDFPDAPSDPIDLAGGEQVGVSCAICHAETDQSVLPAMPDSSLATGGSIGIQSDGDTAHNFDFGTVLAAANNSLAYYPMLQLVFNTLDGATIGRGDFPGLNVTDAQVADPSMINVDALEDQADLYLTGTSQATGERFYPVGQFDAFPEGIGNPLHIAAFFATEQGAPWGIDGGVALLEDFNNTVFTVSLDPTSVATAGGRAFLEAQASTVGLEVYNDYRAVLKATLGDGGVLTDAELDDMIPFVNAQDGLPPGQPSSVVGRRVDDTALLNLNAYLDTLPSPRAPDDIDEALAARGREIFRTLAPEGGNCTTCHQVDPNEFVNPDVIPFETIYPAYSDSLVVIAQRMGLAPIQNSGSPTNLVGPNPFLDDRMIVLDGSRRGEPKGTSFPLLLDLVGKDSLLHDDSVQGESFIDAAMLLLDPERGADAAHPFFIEDEDDRRAVVEFLRSRETILNPETDNSQDATD